MTEWFEIGGSFKYYIEEFENISNVEATCQIILITSNPTIDFNVDHFYLISESNLQKEIFIGNSGTNSLCDKFYFSSILLETDSQLRLVYLTFFTIQIFLGSNT